MSDDIAYAYAYRHESTVSRSSVLLATSGGAAPHPYFFDGFVERAEIVAVALLVVARVARTRFYTPPGMLAAVLRSADPVVTSDGERLRFESFSACCGVYCRLDLLPDGLDRPPLASGTTNVDFNPPMRDALAGVGGIDPVRVAVGADEVRVTTLDASVVERRVPLPARWVNGFGEVQAVAAGMRPRLATSGVALRRFLQALPRTPQRGVLFAVPSAGGLRLASRPSTDAVPVSAVERLRVVEPLLRHASAVRVYAPPGAGEAASAWQVDLPGARITVTLSPSASRGFSGEGGLLTDLADATAAEEAATTLAGASGPALTYLAAAGRVGFDLATGTYFHRELPFRPATLQARHPRLRDARALVEGGHVDLRSADALVNTTYVVRSAPDGDRCTCQWFATHGSSRGPCKHILAVRIARG
ncbi:SWIM zinc finger protein [Asanoa ferruginea]|uniref:SWIM zinc finger protein n=1 Tax=Asanoa ferruginea TaxID=53367 RepID=A0A3E0A065_9ACTN|nr:SWIM zinc finger family protein [Asanoa ferruginea]REG01794.1 SWIM zinc finger protein [Asanoa ferruginea]GIF49172.1 hypothetical protein Afe04nite_37110 [Asanoa ferruginea]